MRHTTILAIFVLSLGLLTACNDDTGINEPQPSPCTGSNDTAPDLTLIDLEGTEHSLEEQRCNKVVILDFWATWCQPCVDLMPALQELHDTYSDQGLEIWAVSVSEDLDTVSSFMTAGGYTFTALLDTLRVAADDHGVLGIPRQFIIDASGEVQIDLQGKTQIMDFEYEDVLPGLLDEIPE